LQSVTKRRLQEILADENRKIFGEKVKLGQLSTESEIVFGNWGKSETERNASLPQRNGRP